MNSIGRTESGRGDGQGDMEYGLRAGEEMDRGDHQSYRRPYRPGEKKKKLHASRQMATDLVGHTSVVDRTGRRVVSATARRSTV